MLLLSDESDSAGVTDKSRISVLSLGRTLRPCDLWLHEWSRGRLESPLLMREGFDSVIVTKHSVVSHRTLLDHWSHARSQRAPSE